MLCVNVMGTVLCVTQKHQFVRTVSTILPVSTVRDVHWGFMALSKDLQRTASLVLVPFPFPVTILALLVLWKDLVITGVLHAHLDMKASIVKDVLLATQEIHKPQEDPARNVSVINMVPCLSPVTLPPECVLASLDSQGGSVLAVNIDMHVMA